MTKYLIGLDLIDGGECEIGYDEETTCPICKTKISPACLHGAVDRDENTFVPHITLTNRCPGCKKIFLTYYDAVSGNGDCDYHAYEIISSEPNRFQPNKFDDTIEALSPQFVKIYNQSVAAESMLLDEIAGIGYRKSFEFLVKDFAISEHPENEHEIKNLWLGNCINTYIDNPVIKNLIEKTTWIGNDETHYVRKHETRGIYDIKKFIDATVHFIAMALIVKDAATIEPKK